MTQRQNFLALLLITGIAIAFRVPLLETLPPGLNFDEGGEGVAALDVAQGVYRLWWPIGGGKQPLMAYLVQPLLFVFGRTVLALRLYPALMGLGAVLACYFFAARLFPPRQSSNPLHTFIPALTAMGLATAFWHVAFSRIAFRALSTPFVEALAFGFFWLALSSERRRDVWLAGAFIGGMIYTYLAGWFVPVVIVLFLAVEALLAWRNRHRPLVAQHGSKLLQMVGAAAVVAGPLLGYFGLNPGAFFDRGQAVSVFSAAAPGEMGSVVLQTTLTTLGTFFSLTGDPNPLANIPGRPELGPLPA
ncbi:MAG: hypothetical protein R3264_21990, partial [Anaerolineae bacterium]|nr:hypothetical protein [Anaerolineae bacterium]